MSENALTKPTKAPLFIGPDVLIQGTVTYQGEDPEAELVVLGEVRGNIFTKGVLKIEEGAIVGAESLIQARQIVVAGKIEGAGVKIQAQIFEVKPTGNVSADVLCLPPGGLEQSRGAVLNVRLEMSADHGTAAVLESPKIRTVQAQTPLVASEPADTLIANLAQGSKLKKEETTVVPIVTSSFPAKVSPYRGEDLPAVEAVASVKSSFP